MAAVSPLQSRRQAPVEGYPVPSFPLPKAPGDMLKVWGMCGRRANAKQLSMVREKQMLARSHTAGGR